MVKTKYECQYCGRQYKDEKKAEICDKVGANFLPIMQFSRNLFIKKHKMLVNSLQETIHKFKEDNEFKHQPLRIISNHQGIIVVCSFPDDISDKEAVTWSNFFDLLTFMAPQGSEAIIQLTDLEIALGTLQKFFGGKSKT